MAAVAESGAREMLVAALSGAWGSAVSKTITYPLESAKTWTMNKKSHETTAEVMKKLWETGIYIGFQAKVTKTVVQKSLFFYIQAGLMILAARISDSRRRARGLKPSGQVGTLALLLSGYFGEMLGIPLFAPIEYIAVQVQTSRTRESASSVVRRTLQESGIAGFYRGWQVYLLCAFQPMVQFALIERARARLLRGKDPATAVLSAGVAFWLGALTKAMAATLTFPINTGRVIIQAKVNGKPTGDKAAALPMPDDEDTVNIFYVLAGVVRKEGVLGLYKGLLSEVAEGILGAAIQLMVKEQVTNVMRALVYGKFL
eukprot:gnl/TRDRNA2_/TRDRNA2_92717_c0_seq1.p1 gnl/TRDRNA2_/TRDRNA2_92717_c0~~gnl/TRDRNA2_/TRDRNA2_92717_c0_seq1.p1  ORF type:complete len:315 (+),score=63.29 gnl/TRDRNA2_/TRDRNA2_92717_c0_seq1:38-982(+)